MDFKIKIVCKCECAFELRSENYSAHTEIVCQNCGAVLPADVTEKINTGISALASIPEDVNGDHFKLTVEHFDIISHYINLEP